MSNINKTGYTLVSNVPQNVMIPFDASRRSYVLSQEVDLTDGAMTLNDVYQILAIPDDTKVSEVHIQLLTKPVGTAMSVTFGDGGSTAGWQGTWDLIAATAGDWKHSAIGTDARMATADNGYFYGTADTIDMVNTAITAITAGPKFKVYAVCMDLN